MRSGDRLSWALYSNTICPGYEITSFTKLTSIAVLVLESYSIVSFIAKSVSDIEYV